MKVAVISGGGALGAYTAGLLKKLNKKYDLVSGVSTGALMAPLVALHNFDRLIEAYTSVDQNKIFNKNPFNKKGHLKIFNLIWGLLLNKRTIGESKNIKTLISNFFTEEDYKKIIMSNRDVIVAAQNLSKEHIEHKSIKNCTYEEFKKWMQASSSVPIIMSLSEINGEDYCDGGVTEIQSLSYILDNYQNEIEEIDVFIHRPYTTRIVSTKIQNIRHFIMRLFNIIMKEVEDNDLELGLEKAFRYNKKINIYYLPEKLTSNSLMFNKKQMQSWVELGFNEGEKYVKVFK